MIPKPTMPMTAPVQSKSKAEVGFRLLTSPVPCCCCQKTLFGLPGFPGSCHGGRLISFLRPCFIIFQKTSQTPRIQPLRSRWGAHLLLSVPAHTQKLGIGGTSVGLLLQDRASGEISVSSKSTGGPTMHRKSAIATGLRQRTVSKQVGSRRGSERPVPRWRPPWCRPWLGRQ